MESTTPNEYIPSLRRVGHTVYVGMQLPVSASGEIDIAEQTDQVFRSLVARLEEAGGSMADLTKLHTYYLFEGDGAAITEYWERMTAVRLRHLVNPGPAATALRVQGVGREQALIAVDGIAELSRDKERIMPEHAWDWSIPTPFSQGWRVGEKVYVGGQISADRQGRTIAPGSVVEQTKNTLEYIEHVLRDAQTTWSNVCALKIAYKHGADPEASRQLGEQILAEVVRRLPAHKPAITIIGVDLLYEGLLLEIDAVASKDIGLPIWPEIESSPQTTARTSSPGWLSGGELHVGAQANPDAIDLETQLEGALSQVAAVLRAAGGSVTDLVKLNVFLLPGESADAVQQMLKQFLAPGRTVVSIVQVAGFLLDGQRVQVDGVALLEEGA